MDNSVLIIVAVVFLVFLLIKYLLKQNKKDKKDLEKTLNNDYKKSDDSDDNQSDPKLNKIVVQVVKYAKKQRSGFNKLIPLKILESKAIKLTSINKKARI